MQATKVRVSPEDFDASEELAAMAGGDAGASVSFIGMVRADGSVLSMELEHYPAMTEKAIAGIIEQARGRWSLEAVTVIHRVGKLLPGDQIVLCAVTSKHRGEAFAACEFIMDWLKTTAPFWKKESTAEGGRWVDARESDDAARERWNLEGAKR